MSKPNQTATITFPHEVEHIAVWFGGLVVPIRHKRDMNRIFIFFGLIHSDDVEHEERKIKLSEVTEVQFTKNTHLKLYISLRKS